MPWISRMFKNRKVWAFCDESGSLNKNGKNLVDFLYQPGGAIYHTSEEKLLPIIPVIFLDETAFKNRSEKLKKNDNALETIDLFPTQTHADGDIDVVHIYVDGACLGNPGPMGAGIVCLQSVKGFIPTQEKSLFLGRGTNNIAELMAVLIALELVDSYKKQCKVVIHTDSAYAIGVLNKNFKARANIQLIEQLKSVIKSFQHVSFVKVLGHSGIKENERCDVLAKQAASLGR